MAKERGQGKAQDQARAVNRLLAMMPLQTFARLQPDLELVELVPHAVLAEPGAPLTHAYFPHRGMVSFLSVTSRGVIEAATVGPEGFTGFEALLGARDSSQRLLIRAAGTASRLPVGVLCEAARESPAFNALLLGSVRCFLLQLTQSVACNGLHSVRERCARWLLTMRDRTGQDRFELTHAALAEMLGVHRPSVTIVARGLQEAGLIRYSRGIITIRDHAGLERVTCECYAVVQTAFRKALSLPRPDSGEDSRQPLKNG